VERTIERHARPEGAEEQVTESMTERCGSITGISDATPIFTFGMERANWQTRDHAL
jgi:hypothetical protein